MISPCIAWGRYFREQGRLESEREERRLSILWPHWGLARHALSARAMRLAAPLIEDMSVDGGEIPALLLSALCNHAVLRFAAARPAWETAPDDLIERITGDYHPEFPVAERMAITANRYQYVAAALKLSERPDWPGLDRIARAIFAMIYGEPEDDGLLAETLYGIADHVRVR